MDMDLKKNLDEGGNLRVKDLKSTGVAILIIIITGCGIYIASLVT